MEVEKLRCCFWDGVSVEALEWLLRESLCFMVVTWVNVGFVATVP